MGSFKDAASALYAEGYNCAQAVALAFADEFGADRETVAKLASSFGGGMGGMRETCGAVSGMLIAYGLARGYKAPDESEKKSEQYAAVRAMVEEFKEKTGSHLCRELLETAKMSSEKKLACKDIVGIAAEIVARKTGRGE